MRVVRDTLALALVTIIFLLAFATASGRGAVACTPRVRPANPTQFIAELAGRLAPSGRVAELARRLRCQS